MKVSELGVPVFAATYPIERAHFREVRSFEKGESNDQEVE